jgi:cytochrome d ubiquinol oxidase subunit II
VTLPTLWFVLVALLWTGFFVLEGFDLGVGMLHGVLGRDEPGRRAAINTIGPLWDGNEVWLVVAAAAMFAAFPAWYATAFSGFYVLVVLLLAALIARGVSFEFRGKRDSPRWHRTWDVMLTTGSVLVPLSIGLLLGNLLHGVPVNASQEFTGGLADLLNAYSVFFALAVLVLCVLHGAAFMALRTTGDLRTRATATARRTAPLAALAVLVLVVWTHAVAGKGVVPNLLQVASVLAVVAAWWLLHEGADGWAFAATSVAMGSTVLSLFADLYPRLLVSSTSPAFDLTVQSSAAGPYALRLVTIVTLVFLPLVLVYQGWTYYVFRERVRVESFSTPHPSAAHAPSVATVPAPRPRA